MKTYTKTDIQSLLDKYLEGQTSLEEEHLLGEYFRTHTIPSEWEDYREMFAWFDSGMDGKYLQGNKTDNINDAQATAGAPVHRTASSGLHKQMRLTLPWLAAACLAGGLAWGLWPRQNANPGLMTATNNVVQQPSHASLPLHAIPKAESKPVAVTTGRSHTPAISVASHKKIIDVASVDAWRQESPATRSNAPVILAQQDSILLAEAHQSFLQWQTINDSIATDHVLLTANRLESKAMIAAAKQDIAQAKQLIDNQDKQHVSLNNIIEL